MTLFDTPPHPRYRHSDPDTSQAAARTVLPVEDQILTVMGFSPLTADQIAAALPRVRQDTLRSALSRLAKAGRIVAAGEGHSNAGRRMTTWRKS